MTDRAEYCEGKVKRTPGGAKTLDDLLNNPGENLTYQDYASDIREILAYNRTQHKDIMSGLNVQFVIADGTFQIKD